MAPLVTSPHDDVRSYCLVALPEFVRATGKATVPSRTQLGTIAEYSLGLLITAAEKENVLELIMTALQALKLVLNYASQDWSAWERKTNPSAPPPNQSGLSIAIAAADANAGKISLSTDEPPSPTPETTIPFLNTEQMITLIQTAKMVLRDSLQRRAVLKAEAAGDIPHSINTLQHVTY